MALQRKIITVVFENGQTETFRQTPLLELAAERRWKMSLGKLETSTQISQLAWTAAEMRAKKNGTVVPDLETWLEDVDTIDIDLEDIVPTKAAPTSSGPQNSPSQPELTPES